MFENINNFSGGHGYVEAFILIFYHSMIVLIVLLIIDIGQLSFLFSGFIIFKWYPVNEGSLSNLFIAAIQCLKRKRLYEQQIEQLGNFQLRIHDQVLRDKYLIIFHPSIILFGLHTPYKLCLHLVLDDNARGGKSYNRNC